MTHLREFLKNGSVIVNLGDSKLYKVNKENLSLELMGDVTDVEQYLKLLRTIQEPVTLLQKSQFECGKHFLMDPRNPDRINIEEAEDYFKIGFLTEEEFNAYRRLEVA